MSGSLILLHTPPGNNYYGEWGSAFDYFNCWFHYETSTATGWSEAAWSNGPTSDHGDYPERDITLPPFLSYQASEVDADNWDWWARLLITV